MAMLNESNLLAMRARAAKFRTNHVGTKLNEAELHETLTLRTFLSSHQVRVKILSQDIRKNLDVIFRT